MKMNEVIGMRKVTAGYITAGGPGSGRKPSGIHQEMHDALGRKGFSFSRASGGIGGNAVYTHPNGTQVKVPIHTDDEGSKSAEWEHSKDTQKLGSGKGASSLVDHFHNFKVDDTVNSKPAFKAKPHNFKIDDTF